MTPAQIHAVQTSFEAVAPQAEAVAAQFYGHLFAQHPELRPLFRGEIRTQGQMLMQTLALAVRGLHMAPALVPTLRRLGDRHRQYGVRAEHYPMVAASLLWTLEQGLGAAFTDELREAWTAAYGLLAGVMLQGAEAAATPAAA
ncbi:MAG TPA: globin family protein [Nevskiaceae bacterium]|nr:globin family protein [Nevskiaceae bacterium]